MDVIAPTCHYMSVCVGLGASVYTQGWSLRRMVSLFNLIVRRGHVPREEAIRRLMGKVGLVVEPNSGEAEDGECSDLGLEDEGGESEHDATDDEVVEGGYS